jgi:hypothetical protein
MEITRRDVMLGALGVAVAGAAGRRIAGVSLPGARNMAWRQIGTATGHALEPAIDVLPGLSCFSRRLGQHGVAESYRAVDHPATPSETTLLVLGLVTVQSIATPGYVELHGRTDPTAASVLALPTASFYPEAREPVTRLHHHVAPDGTRYPELIAVPQRAPSMTADFALVDETGIVRSSVGLRLP